MKQSEVLSKVDHTLLRQCATWAEIQTICDDAVEYATASVCIAPCYVKAVKEYVQDKIEICTVIGFPNGYNTTETKCFEAANAVHNGANEIDMVINMGWVKERAYDKILDEINQVKRACKGRLLKVIIETCFLNQEEKSQLCDVVSQSMADFIKTSTGFGTGGATKEDIELFASLVSNDTKIKAAGGIKNFEDAQVLLHHGANRLGTSVLVTIMKEVTEE